MASRRVSLVVPGLFGPEAVKHLPALGEGWSLPALEQLLSRAERSVLPVKGYEASLSALFGLELPMENDVPVAAVTRQWEAKDAGNHWWLRADPVHLMPDRDRLVMMGNSALDISAEECAQLAEELNSHFAEQNWDLRAANARRWYLCLGADPQLRTEPLLQVLGQDVLHHLPKGPAAAEWRGLLNEAQMVLHASVINREREARGVLPVNSLWFWGGGRLPTVPRAKWSQVWSNDAFAQGLANLSDVPCSTLPSDAEEWIEMGGEGDQLIVLDGLREKVQFDNVEAWRDMLQTIHDHWLQKLYTLLKQRHIEKVDILAADGVCWGVTTRAARRWWVRSRPWPTWLSSKV